MLRKDISLPDWSVSIILDGPTERDGGGADLRRADRRLRWLVFRYCHNGCQSYKMFNKKKSPKVTFLLESGVGKKLRALAPH